MNGEDEHLCETLEMAECSENEFRCHYGGQCIPLGFVRDGEKNTDCLDGTDELKSKRHDRDIIEFQCSQFSTFQCEELTGRRSFTSLCTSAYNLVDILDDQDTDFRKSCNHFRTVQTFNKMLSSTDHIRNFYCRQAAHYLLIDCFGFTDLQNDLVAMDYESLMMHCPLDVLIIPEFPILFGYFQVLYLKNQSYSIANRILLPNYICFNASRCPRLTSCPISIVLQPQLHCCETKSLIKRQFYDWTDWNPAFKDLVQQCSTVGTDETCSDPSLFHCSSSLKCISKARLVDGYDDCYDREDELYSACQLNDSSRFICRSDPNKCLSMIALSDGKADCPNGEDEWPQERRGVFTNQTLFGLFCDRENDFLSTTTTSNDTDETNCEFWPCNNPYFRCDNVWHCLNGEDELDCPESSCLSNEHACGILFSNVSYCIPVEKLMEKPTDCSTLLIRSLFIYNETYNDLSNYYLWNKTKCLLPEHICWNQSFSSISQDDVCLIQSELSTLVHTTITLQEKRGTLICTMSSNEVFRRKRKIFLQTSKLSYFPMRSAVTSTIKMDSSKQSFPIVVRPRKISKENLNCHRGIAVLFNNKTTERCLCPPSYFGRQCQWQNQRISLTFQIICGIIPNFVPVFQLIIMMIDQNEVIQSSHEQIIYIPKHDCTTKFNVYLLYPDRPKSIESNYSIRIDLFDKQTLRHWASWHLSIPFQFLPINRLSTQLFIPKIQPKEPCPLSCGNHGRCVFYANKNFSYFCQCDSGYSGRHCQIKENCSCASDSFCLTSSICICPMTKFGPNCYLKHSICQSSNNPCENNGLCIPLDYRINIHSFVCLCPENFHGSRCEKKNNAKIEIEFDENLLQITSIIFAHLITAFEQSEHQMITIVKKIKYGNKKISLDIIQPFHILIVETSKQNYYLAVRRERFFPLEQIQTRIQSQQQCLSIERIVNSTFQTYSYLHRMKFYPYFCRQNPHLMCFYDENYMCLCDVDRYSNCFLFNHSLRYDCLGHNDCENDGQCFQDNNTCPSSSLCICSDCFYGSKCQFSTKGFVPSLDYILGYHIKPNRSFNAQPFLIKFSATLITLICLSGLISAILSILTFSMKKTRNVGSTCYLFLSSWISVALPIVLLFKFYQLVFSQMTNRTNRSFLMINCIFLDFMLRILSTINDWLYGFITLDRTLIVIQGVRFNRSRSKKFAQRISITLILSTILTYLHDPLHRQLIDDIDVDERRTWCLVQYSSAWNIFNSLVTVFHVFIPLTMNLFFTSMMIFSIARSRSNVQTRLPFNVHFQLQLKEHKHCLIASIAIVSLTIPRIIVSFASGCMRSPRHSWFYLLAYLIQFLPSMMIFIIYILPSKLYKQQLNVTLNHYTRRIRRFVL